MQAGRRRGSAKGIEAASDLAQPLLEKKESGEKEELSLRQAESLARQVTA
jgi:hypothetical protein